MFWRRKGKARPIEPQAEVKCVCAGRTDLNELGELYEKGHLTLLKQDFVNWTSLYACLDSFLFWEKYYPHSEMHGGEPPAYRRLSPKEAQQAFGQLPSEAVLSWLSGKNLDG
jgi:hypothetical protein